MKKLIIGLVVVIAVVIGITLLNAKKAEAPTNHMATPPQSGADPNTAPRSGNAVTIEGYAFSPKNLTIKKGTTVVWTNQDVAKHNVVVDEGAPAGGPNGPLFGKGETYKFSFDTVGTYNYHCDPHPYMHGSVTVTE